MPRPVQATELAQGSVQATELVPELVPGRARDSGQAPELARVPGLGSVRARVLAPEPERAPERHRTACATRQ